MGGLGRFRGRAPARAPISPPLACTTVSREKLVLSASWRPAPRRLGLPCLLWPVEPIEDASVRDAPNEWPLRRSSLLENRVCHAKDEGTDLAEGALGEAAPCKD